MNLGRLRIGDWATALAGVLMLAVMFADWYKIEGGGRAANAWDALGVLDVVLAVAAVSALVSALVTAFSRTAAVPIAVMSVTTFLALLALVWLLVRVAWPPEMESGAADTERLGGMWLGLVFALGLLGGSLAAIRDESPSLRAPAPHEAPDRSPGVAVTKLPAPPPGGEQPAAR